MEIKNLQIFADNPTVNVTTDGGLSAENKTFYDRALLLIEAAETAGGAGRVWEIVGSGGSIRVLSGGSLSSRGVTQTEAGLCVGDASGGNDRAVPLSIYALKGDGVT